jgi:hypothetical protein
MATSAIKQIFNLNPLIKLDGYYLLSDWLDAPNLRQRSFQYVGARFKRLLGVVNSLPELALRERRIYVAYGLVAVVFSSWLLSTMLIAFGRYFTYRWHGWGAALWVGLLVGVLGNVGGRSPIRWPAWLSPKNHRLRLLAVLAAGLLVLYFVPLELKVGGDVEVAPARNTDVRAQVEGIIEDVFVRERDRVAAGDTLARLADRDYRARLEMADAELAEKAREPAAARGRRPARGTEGGPRRGRQGRGALAFRPGGAGALAAARGDRGDPQERAGTRGSRGRGVEEGTGGRAGPARPVDRRGPPRGDCGHARGHLARGDAAAPAR